jgi:WD40 repeat protein
MALDLAPDWLFSVSAQAKGELTAELRGHTETVNDLVFSLDNAHLYSCGSDMKIIEWNADAGQLSRCVRNRDPGQGVTGQAQWRRLHRLFADIHWSLNPNLRDACC